MTKRSLLQTLLLALALLTLSAAPSLAQQPCQWSYSFIGGVATATYCGNIVVDGTGGGGGGGATQGVFNVRTQFGGVPDGATDNTTAITNAFTASNAFNSTPDNGAAGVPTVYFDCDITKTVCEYNYGGSGQSPINPQVPTTILCAPGVSLNYTGTAHAVDLGPFGLSAQATIGRYLVQGCQFTGGGSSTGGIFPNNYLENMVVQDNVFLNYGSPHPAICSILITGQNYRMKVLDNNWIDNDGIAKCMIDSHSSTNPDLLFSRNKTSCLNDATSACSVSTIGVGAWVNSQADVSNNEITFHQPAVRVSGANVSAERARITNNYFEGNSGVTGPALTYGDPGVAAQVVSMLVMNNQFYWPSVSGVPIVAGETPSSGTNQCNNCAYVHNLFGPAPSGSTTYINDGFGFYTYLDDNIGPTANSVPLSQSSTPPLLDSGSFGEVARQVSTTVQGGSGALGGRIPTWDATVSYFNAAGFPTLSAPLFCNYTGGSGTAATCTTSPEFNAGGTAFAPVAGSMIIFETATANTSTTYTIAINGGSALPVLKNGAAIAAGNIPANVPEMLLFDGTNLQYNHP